MVRNKLARNRERWVMLTCIVVAGLLLAGCGGKGPQSYTIGVLINNQGQMPFYDGFKAGMTELGYVEGQDLTYLYDGPTGTLEAVRPEAEKLKAQQPDLILAIGTATAQVAKEVFADTEIPIVFVPAFYPDKEGLVDSFARPGGNLTGINNTDTLGKGLEWLVKVVPTVKRVYVPHDPNDQAAVQSLQSLTDAAKTLNLELVVAGGTTLEEMGAIAKNIPADIDAVFVERSGTITNLLPSMLDAATARRIPVVTSNVGMHVDLGALLAYGPSLFEMGKQAARLADQVLRGADPATLPVENAEAYLGVNLKTAQAIGITMPDEVLRQATQIVRP